MRTIKNPLEFRGKVRDQFIQLINKPIIAVNIEIGIYNFSVTTSKERKVVRKWDNVYFCEIYMSKLRMVLYNLRDKPSLISQLVNKELRADRVGYMTHQDLQPDKWAIMIDQKKKRDENMFAPNLMATTDDFTCYKCKSKKCTYYQLQTRSADESMTTYVTCLDCGNRWKC
jgi:transcription elongation factor S-II